MKVWSFVFGLLLLGCCVAYAADDCGCSTLLSPKDELAASAVVMEAYVVAMGTTTGDSTAYEVNVNKVWKGEPMTSAIIHARGAGTSCAVTLEIGKNYLIYAKGKDLSTDVCSRTFDQTTHVGQLNYQEDLSAFKK